MNISLNECVDLRRLDDGRVVVVFEGEQYERDAPVPLSTLGENYRLDARPAVFFASHLVEVCMSGKFGSINHWPTAAVEFVYPNEPASSPELKL